MKKLVGTLLFAGILILAGTVPVQAYDGVRLEIGYALGLREYADNGTVLSLSVKDPDLFFEAGLFQGSWDHSSGTAGMTRSPAEQSRPDKLIVSQAFDAGTFWRFGDYFAIRVGGGVISVNERLSRDDAVLKNSYRTSPIIILGLRLMFPLDQRFTLVLAANSFISINTDGGLPLDAAFTVGIFGVQF